MNSVTIAIVIIVGVAAGFLSATLLLRFLPPKEKAKLEKVEDNVLPAIEKGLTYAGTLIQAFTAVVPNKYASAVEIIVNGAFEAVKNVEVICKGGALPADQRKGVATTLIQTDLKNAGITADSNLNKLISIVVDDVCLVKPGAFEAAPTVK